MCVTSSLRPFSFAPPCHTTSFKSQYAACNTKFGRHLEAEASAALFEDSLLLSTLTVRAPLVMHIYPAPSDVMAVKLPLTPSQRTRALTISPSQKTPATPHFLHHRLPTPPQEMATYLCRVLVLDAAGVLAQSGVHIGEQHQQVRVVAGDPGLLVQPRDEQGAARRLGQRLVVLFQDLVERLQETTTATCVESTSLGWPRGKQQGLTCVVWRRTSLQ